jgi:hypothetical protein
VGSRFNSTVSLPGSAFQARSAVATAFQSRRSQATEQNAPRLVGDQIHSMIPELDEVWPPFSHSSRTVHITLTGGLEDEFINRFNQPGGGENCD